MDIGMDGGATDAPLVHCLPAREASHDGNRRPGYPEAQHRLIKDSTADAVAMDINDTVNNNFIGLQIEADAPAEMVEALRLVSTHTPIGREATAYTSMSIKELKRAICAKQSHDSLVQQV